jgi:3-hydroxy-9,10-secoandrosta-1,3,5(10)-triene-9,17-dione monooxygenase reductase component
VSDSATTPAPTDVNANGATDPAIDGAAFRSALGHFLTGVTIITAMDPDATVPVGLAASSFSSVSLDPPLVLFCAGKTSSSWERIDAAGSYCVNILGDDQEALSRRFATRGADKFAGLGWTAGASGSPVLSDSLAWIDCRIQDRHDAGDHVIVVGRVLGLGVRGSGAPLAYFRGGYGAFSASA